LHQQQQYHTRNNNNEFYRPKIYFDPTLESEKIINKNNQPASNNVANSNSSISIITTTNVTTRSQSSTPSNVSNISTSSVSASPPLDTKSSTTTTIQTSNHNQQQQKQQNSFPNQKPQYQRQNFYNNNNNNNGSHQNNDRAYNSNNNKNIYKKPYYQKNATVSGEINEDKPSVNKFTNKSSHSAHSTTTKTNSTPALNPFTDLNAPTGPMSSLLITNNRNLLLAGTHLTQKTAADLLHLNNQKSQASNNSNSTQALSKELRDKITKIIDEFLVESSSTAATDSDSQLKNCTAKYLQKINDLKLNSNDQSVELIYMTIVNALSKTDLDRFNASKLFIELNRISSTNNNNNNNKNIALNGSSGDLFMIAFKSILQNLNTLESEFHFVKSNISLFVARAVCDQIITFADLASLMKYGAYYPLFFLCMQMIQKKNLIALSNFSSPEYWLRGQIEKSKINLLDMLPNDDRNRERLAQVLEDRELIFLMPMLKLEPLLYETISSDTTTDSLHLRKWIDETIDASVRDTTDFIQSLVSCVIRNACEKTVLLKNNSSQIIETDASSSLSPHSSSKMDKLNLKQQKDLIRKYQDVLYEILKSNLSKQIEAIYALQVYAASLGKIPKYFLAHLFNQMYDLDLIEEEAFYLWKDELNDSYPNKGQALFDVFFYYIKIQSISIF
jgi:translation initiation factor 4G